MNTSKLTQKSIDAINRAQSVASEYGNSQLTQEHLLYALVSQENGLISEMFSRLGANLAPELLDAISKFPKVHGGQTYLAQETEAALSAAEQRAAQMKDEYISVEHIMLGIFDKASKSISELLKKHGITEAEFLKLLSSVRGNARVTSDNPEETYDALKKYGSDLVELARAKKLDPVIGRDSEIRNVIRILSRKTKNNPVLIGEPGVGKTAIAEGLALRIVRGGVPE